jgi:hypothetical protein
MKTTVELSDDLYRRAKSEAALRGRKLKDLDAGIELFGRTFSDCVAKLWM